MAFRDNDREDRGSRGFSRDRGNRGGGRSFGGRDGGRGGRDGGRSFGGRGGRDSGRPQMHDAVCANCEKECQVPFRPTGERPVLCRDCFGKGGDSQGSNDSSPRRERPAQSSSAPGVSPAQFKELSLKVDKILEILESIGSEEDEEEEEAEDEEQ